MLIGVTCAAFAVTGWRPGRALGLLGTGLLVAAAADGFFLWQGVTGFDVGSTAITALTPASLLLVGFAAWQPPAPRPQRAEPEGWRTVAMPSAFAFAALAVVVVHAIAPRQALALGLAAATLAAVIVRMSVALAEHMKLLAASRTEALTDALTGLGNRRSLMLQLEAEVTAATEAAPRAVMLFDLDGFKQYNDWHGHPAGDALLRRLGERLAAAVAPNASAYRLGGDEFCVLAVCDESEACSIRTGSIEALTDRDGGFEVGTSCGFVMVPRDAAVPSAVLQVADKRLYMEKAERRGVRARHQAPATAREHTGDRTASSTRGEDGPAVPTRPATSAPRIRAPGGLAERERVAARSGLRPQLELVIARLRERHQPVEPLRAHGHRAAVNVRAGVGRADRVPVEQHLHLARVLRRAEHQVHLARAVVQEQPRPRPGHGAVLGDAPRAAVGEVVRREVRRCPGRSRARPP